MAETSTITRRSVLSGVAMAAATPFLAVPAQADGGSRLLAAAQGYRAARSEMERINREVAAAGSPMSRDLSERRIAAAMDANYAHAELLRMALEVA